MSYEVTAVILVIGAIFWAGWALFVVRHTRRRRRQLGGQDAKTKP